MSEETWKCAAGWKVFVDVESSEITEVDWEPIAEMVEEAMEAGFQAGFTRVVENVGRLYPQLAHKLMMRRGPCG